MVVIFCYVFGAKVAVAESIVKFRSSCLKPLFPFTFCNYRCVPQRWQEA